MTKQMTYNVSYVHREYGRLRKDKPEILFAYECLNTEDQQTLDALVIQIRDQMTDRSDSRMTLGASSILELLYCLGRFINKRGYSA